ncbi:PIR protein [Plasmodium yoelii]|uniref:PIR protein n=2 Tax=Plasmodium yoelii TaxID=5861 RepID=A0AAE9WYL2_PLAYO|nr:PIR protein [Plasmodium yoelii]WBY61371.1 PIR protein [Plasmodium yoelii yoelii]VTZ82025.1 PIR protein [Plasmodium yoelii]|eukprot:XP_022811121.1 PIR protein [Plasmodium yoelii]
MNKEVCKKFQDLRNSLTDYLNGNGRYEFINENNFDEYCTDNKCDDNLGKINAGCLYLFDAFFKNSANFVSVAKSNINIVEYIIIWLSYMLFFTTIDENDSINIFYKTHINNDDTDNKYNQEIDDVAAYTSYKDLIDKKENLMSISIIDMSYFYDAFILLCDMYIAFNNQSPNCDNYLNNAKKFVEMYDALNEDYYNGEGSPYNQLLSTLSDDYCNLKNKCNQFPTLPTYSRRFVIKRTLIPIAFMIVALSIFLGIEYKYSLLGFRKRSQKQKLREKIKNIMKKMIH